MADGVDLTTFTSTSIGYVISLVLPGMTAIFTASLYSPTIARTLHNFDATGSGFGLFLVVLLASMTVSLVLMPIADLIYARWLNALLSIRSPLTDAQRARLSDPKVLQSWRALVDEQFRFFQFWGAISIVIPFLTGGIARHSSASDFRLGLLAAAGALVESIVVFAAIEALRRQSKYEQTILS
jgi:hypothetical protein